MKINDPVQSVPASMMGRGKYAEIYAALDRLTNGDWLPVTFDTRMEAYNFRVSATTQRKRSVEVVLRGETCYIRDKPETQQQATPTAKPSRKRNRK